LFRFISLPFIFSAQTPDETISLGHVDKLFAPLNKPDSLHSIVPEQSAPTSEGDQINDLDPYASDLTTCDTLVDFCPEKELITFSEPRPEAPIVTGDLAPLANRDDGFRTENRNPHVDNTNTTIDHPNIKRTSYTIFRLENPNSRNAEPFHAGKVVLFCCASARTIDGDFCTSILPGGYLISANAFNDGARLSSKCFVTLNSQFGKAIIPTDAINIHDFRLDEDFVQSLERTIAQIESVFRSETEGKKAV